MTEKHKFEKPIETRKVPCFWDENKRCEHSCCRYKFYSELAKKFYDIWFKEAQRELIELKEELGERKEGG